MTAIPSLVELFFLRSFLSPSLRAGRGVNVVIAAGPATTCLFLRLLAEAVRC